MKAFMRPSFLFAILAMALIVYEVRLLMLTQGYVSLQDVAVLNEEVKALKSNVALSSNEVQLLRDQLDRVKVANAESEIALLLREEIGRYKTYAGLTDVTGEGVLIVIDDGERALLDSENPNDLVVHDRDMATIVDDLRNSGAEAISVNNTRIIAGITEIICNGPTIRINGIQQAPPYVIRAIGDRFKLESKLLDPDLYAYSLKRQGLKMEVNTNVKLTIVKLNKQAQFKYAKLLK